jgi:hypothetical protein
MLPRSYQAGQPCIKTSLLHNACNLPVHRVSRQNAKHIETYAKQGAQLEYQKLPHLSTIFLFLWIHFFMEFFNGKLRQGIR